MQLENIISRKTDIAKIQVISALKLLEEGNTIPFIARYRKEATNNLDEIALKKINDLKDYLNELHERKRTIIRAITKLNKMTPGLLNSIENIEDKTELEDIYAPYKPKKSSRAQTAREKGLGPLALLMLDVSVRSGVPSDYAEQFINPDMKIHNIEDAIKGACDIIAEDISNNAQLRKYVRQCLFKEGYIVSKVKKDYEKQASKFNEYYDFREKLRNIPSHRILAVLRGENSKILTVSFDFDTEKMIVYANHLYKESSSVFSEHINNAVKDGLKRLLLPSIFNETKRLMKEKADLEAVRVFSQNLKNILMSAPLGENKVLSIDPGMRTGGKMAVLSENGEFLEGDVFYFLNNNPKEGIKIIDLIKKYNIKYIALGNGTGSREIDSYLKKIFKYQEIDTEIILVNESGASIYSASEIAADEFPELDITMRSAISIGRRLQDPMAELVKIEPKSIGVGQYQHDVDQKLLKKELDETVLFCVNRVGINLNTASISLLKYVSGITPRVAENIINYRQENGPFKNRLMLKKVAGLGEKSFTQSAGFFRIKNSDPVENTGIHPEQYNIVQNICNMLNTDLQNLIRNNDLLSRLCKREFIVNLGGEYTFNDILQELKKPGLDIREQFENISFRDDVRSIADIKKDMILNGIITNITNFGAFCDIGVHQDGLIHISEITQKFIKDPNEVLKTGQHVRVKVIDTDIERKRISLTMKF